MKRISWFAIKANGKKEHEQNKIILGMGEKNALKLFSNGCENHSEISNIVNNNEEERTDSVLFACIAFNFWMCWMKGMKKDKDENQN